MKSCPNNLLQRSFSCLSCFNSFGYNYWPYTLRQSHAQCLTSPLKAPLSRRRFRYLKSLPVAKKRNKKLAEVVLNPLKHPVAGTQLGYKRRLFNHSEGVTLSCIWGSTLLPRTSLGDWVKLGEGKGGIEFSCQAPTAWKKNFWYMLYTSLHSLTPKTWYLTIASTSVRHFLQN